MQQKTLILASTSKYRQALLRQLGVSFSVVAQEIDESPHATEPPRATCLRLAKAKASAALMSAPPNSLIIGSDQVLDLDGEAVSKPGSFERALEQLRRARGRTLVSYTAVALLDTASQRLWADVVPTHVHYRDLPEAELVAYLRKEQPYDCAGAVKVETSGISLLARVTSDDPSALIGLPLIRLTDFLREAGFSFG